MLSAARFTLLFGSHADLDRTMQAVAAKLDAKFQAHSSDYLGGDWRAVPLDDEEVVVQWNAELDEPMEPINFPTIVYVHTGRPDDLRRALEGDPLEFVRSDGWST